jgi:hypothetical protein
MTQQLDDLVRALRAEIMGAIGHHRMQERGRLHHPHPGGPVSPFLDAIAAHRERYKAKLSTMRTLKQAPSAEIDAAETKINALADAEIQRAQSAGRVDYAGDDDPNDHDARPRRGISRRDYDKWCTIKQEN